VNEFLMAHGWLFHRAVLKASDVLTISWLGADVSHVIAITMLILATLTPENVRSVTISLLCKHAWLCKSNLFIVLFLRNNLQYVG